MIVGALAVMVVLDVMALDPRRGAYSKPYAGSSGLPVAFSELDVTPFGFVKRGYVLDLHLDCTTGTLALEAFKQRRVLRKLTAGEIALHKPREACRKRGLPHGF